MRLLGQRLNCLTSVMMKEAIVAELPLHELVIHFPSFKIVARDMRGNAFIFLVPINQASVTSQFKRL